MTLIIAEAGVNHNGSEKLAIELIEVAHAAGADVVKFQTFSAEQLVTAEASQASYQVKNTGKQESQLDMLKRLELSLDVFQRLKNHCEKIGIEFLSTAFDQSSLDYLTSELDLKRLKIPSGELTNLPFVFAHAKTGLDLIVSTGMANIDEIQDALGVIAAGYLYPHLNELSESVIVDARESDEGKAVLKEKVCLLHCTTEYPAAPKDINLNAMDTMTDVFGLKVGYSDHSAGITISTAAVAKGATVIEKHFTLDKNMEGPDHKASLEPQELKSLVMAIRDVEMALGSGEKKPSQVELPNRVVARKSLVAAQPISKGDQLTKDNIVAKRPGSGMSPRHFWRLLGQKASRAYETGEMLDE